ncbi:MAG: 2-phosphosulfolactate phosphatase [Christensenellaceae bacterium]|nr:2-phosphosulfolactate phosphatase [Christensenellaceae bacterium]
MLLQVTAQNYKKSGYYLKGHTVIVVDVLRATSSIIWACRNGATKVIPAADPGEGASMAARMGGCLLAGERDGLKLPGFDLGNSPSEFTRDTVQGKTIVISTTNGTGAIRNMESAGNLLIGGMLNRTAVAKRAVELGNDIIIACAGTEGEFSADDILAAGCIASAIVSLTELDEQCDLTIVSRLVYESWKKGSMDIAATHHYRHLVEMGFIEDARFCLQEDVTDVVPVYNNGMIQPMA